MGGSVVVGEHHTRLRTRLAEAVRGDFLHRDCLSCNRIEVKLLLYLVKQE